MRIHDEGARKINICWLYPSYIQIEITERNKAEIALQETMRDLERFNRLAVGGEFQMIELKQEVNDLLLSIGRQEKYNISSLENAKNRKGG